MDKMTYLSYLSILMRAHNAGSGKGGGGGPDPEFQLFFSRQFRTSAIPIPNNYFFPDVASCAKFLANPASRVAIKSCFPLH